MTDRIKRTRNQPAEETENVDTEDGIDTSTQEGETEREAVDRILQTYKDKIRSPSTAIRAFCVTCMGGQVRMVAKCTAPTCPLYPFRFGTNPMHGRVGQKNPKAGKRLHSAKR
jgi:hypothetical protein